MRYKFVVAVFITDVVLIGFVCCFLFTDRLTVLPATELASLRGCSNTRADKYYNYSVGVYMNDVRKRIERVQRKYKGDPDRVIPWDGPGKTYLWDLFPPSFNCPYRERLGRFVEGGKVLCNWEVLSRRGRDAVVMSFGVNNDITFELDLARRTTATIHAFDPSVSSLPGGSQRVEPCGPRGGAVVFHKLGLDGGSPPPPGYQLYSLEDLMRRVGVSCVDLLKIDCEDCEWGAFREMRKHGILKHVDQLSIELHLKERVANKPGAGSGVREVFELMAACEEAGLYPFSWEANYNAPGWNGQMPWAIEYTFVRPGSDYINVPPYGVQPVC